MLSDQLEGSINSIPMHFVKSIITVPSDMKVKLLSGDVKLKGEFLENIDGDPEETLLVTGELMVTTAFQKVGYKSVILAGEIFAPKVCEHTLTSSISQWHGEAFFYSGEPKFFVYLKQRKTGSETEASELSGDISEQIMQALYKGTLPEHAR